jgi:hypothetical protein
MLKTWNTYSIWFPFYSQMKEIINQTHLSNLQTSMIQNKKQSSIQQKYKQDLDLSRTASFNKIPVFTSET